MTHTNEHPKLGCSLEMLSEDRWHAVEYYLAPEVALRLQQAYEYRFGTAARVVPA